MKLYYCQRHLILGLPIISILKFPSFVAVLLSKYNLFGLSMQNNKKSRDQNTIRFIIKVFGKKNLEINSTYGFKINYVQQNFHSYNRIQLSDWCFWQYHCSTQKSYFLLSQFAIYPFLWKYPGFLFAKHNYITFISISRVWLTVPENGNRTGPILSFRLYLCWLRGMGMEFGSN